MDGAGSIVAIRFALTADLMAAFGLALFARTGLRGDAAALPVRPLLLALTAAGIALSLVGLWALAAQMAGVGFGAVDRATLTMLVAETTPGTAFVARIAALVAAVALLSVAPRALAPVAMLAAVALATLAWNGHGAMDEGAAGWLHLGADIVHLLAAGLWLGALFALLLLVARRDADAAHVAATHRALAGFSATGTAIVTALVVTGIVNGAFLIGLDRLPTLGDTLYGRLMIAKLALFTAMLALAAANRFRLTPALAGDAPPAMRALRRSLATESGAALAIVALVAWLGTLEPPVSA